MFSIDPMSRYPIYEQLIDQIERYILTGIFPPMEQLPSVRTLSIELSVNPNTIQKAYSDLDARKIIFSVPGKGCFVSENARELLGEFKRKKLSEIEDSLREMKVAGISRDEISKIVDAVYGKKEAEQ